MIFGFGLVAHADLAVAADIDGQLPGNVGTQGIHRKQRLRGVFAPWAIPGRGGLLLELDDHAALVQDKGRIRPDGGKIALTVEEGTTGPVERGIAHRPSVMCAQMSRTGLSPGAPLNS